MGCPNCRLSTVDSRMKTDLVDVNETRKNLRVEIPSDVVDAEIDRIARDYSRKARDSRLPARQGAGARHQAALQGSDPPRRRARPHSARGRRRAARAGRRGGRHARHPRRERRGGPGAHLHRVVRHAAGVRARRLLDGLAAAAVDARSTRPRSIRRCSGCASAPRASSRSRAAASIDGDTVTLDLERRRTRDGRRPTTHTDVAHRARRQGEPAGLRRAAARPRGRRHEDASRCTTRPTTRSGSWPTPTSRTR